MIDLLLEIKEKVDEQKQEPCPLRRKGYFQNAL